MVDRNGGVCIACWMKKILRNCGWCGAEIMRFPVNHNTGKPIEFSFCNTNCKGEWQRENLKPLGVTKEWLVQKYEIEGLDCAEIGRLVRRDTKRVWEWLRDYNIPTRTRGTSTKKQWVQGNRVHPGGYAHSDATKTRIRQLALSDGRVPYLTKDGTHYMLGRNGPNHHGWQGGLTPEREAISRTQEWADAVKAVWARADAKCERCGSDHRAIDNRKADGFHIHHIAGFSRYPEKRCDIGNLVLLCRPCHHFVHSKKNLKKEFVYDGH